LGLLERTVKKAGVEMKTNKLIGVLLLVLTAATVLGMILKDQAYWNVYNYATILICGVGGIVLLRQK